MKKLLKSSERIQPGGVYRVIELDKYIIINGLVHDRRSMRPTGRYAISPSSSAVAVHRPMSSLYSVAKIDTSTDSVLYRDNTLYNTELVDSEDENIIYKIMPARGNPDMRIIKYVKNSDGSVDDVSETSYTGDYSAMHRFIGQNSEYIFTTLNRNLNDVNNAGMNYLCRVNKKTFAVDMSHFAREKLYPVFENKIRIYVMTDTANNTYSVGYIDKSTWAWNRIGTYNVPGSTGSGAWTRQRTMTTRHIDDRTFSYYFAFDGAGSAVPRQSTPCICRAIVNTISDGTSFIEQKIDFSKCNKPITDLYTIPNISSWERYSNLKTFIVGDKTYLTLCHTKVNYTEEDTILTRDTSKLYLFEIDEEKNTLYCLDAVSTGNVFQTVMYAESGRHVCFARASTVRVFSLDENTMRFKQSFEMYYPEEVSYFGVDKDNTMWIQDVNNNVYTEKIPFTFNLYARYKDDIAQFKENETEIRTHISVGYRDYYKKYSSRKVKITLDSAKNQCFVSNDTNVIVVTLRDDGMLDIPITVFKPGYLTYDIEFV